MKTRLTPALAILLAAGPAAALAADGPQFRLSGFGTVAAVQVDQPGVEFVQPGMTSGAGESASFKSDSRLGVQGDVKFDSTFSATLQVLAKHSGSGDDKPRVEWAFGKAKLGHGFSVRVGRIGAPYFAVSDFREVGYANTWLRTPVDVYGQVIFRTFDGADLLYAGELAGIPVTAQVLAGGSDVMFTRTKIEFEKVVGLNATAELADGVTLRAGHIRGDLTVDSATMRQLVTTLAATPFASVGRQIDCNERKASFTGVGLSLDRGNWVGATEYTQRRSDCYVPDTTGWHVMGGYRFGNLTPYAIVSRVKLDDSNVVNNIPTGVSPQLTALSGAVTGLLRGVNVTQESLAIGVRWDAMANVAVKAQWERIDPQNGPGMFRLTGTTAPTEPVNVLSLAVDFVF